MMDLRWTFLVVSRGKPSLPAEDAARPDAGAVLFDHASLPDGPEHVQILLHIVLH